MKVLVTNDDGIEAPGIYSLVKALNNAGHTVYVAAPKDPASGMGKALKVRARYGEARYEGARRAWWVESTPATAVYLAINLLVDEEIDAVVSGVNRGPNIGLEDLLTSGTIGAVMEAALNGLPGVAVSLATDKGVDPGEYDLASNLAARLVPMLAVLDPGEFVNLNVPENPRGVMATRLAWNNYRVRLKRVDGFVAPEAHGFRERYWDLAEGTDVWAVMNDYVSVTVIDLRNLTDSIVDLERTGEIARNLGLPRRGLG
ncbi:MAG: 5'/3'-nucleotidase SurE [Desulfurococcales archaeon]|nr:5'/3'-nucleotidase SurE [Desulfurococcales archaeon]